MNVQEFQTQMMRIQRTFDKVDYNVDRAKLIFDSVQDLDFYEFKRIVDQFIKTSRQAPMPSDFIQAADSFRKSRPRNVNPNEGLEPDCRHCVDVGFFQVAYHDTPESKTLMRCSCPIGETRHPKFFIPQWEPKIAAVFKRESCPLSWFKPKDGVFDPEKPVYSLRGIVDAWMERLRLADGHWRAVSNQEGA